MAIIIEGRSKCKICGMTMSSQEELIAFPRFTINENDPLYFFYDRVFHKECFLSHSKKKNLIEKLIRDGYFEEYKDILDRLEMK
ncbi:hypothetical protein OA93_15490 [Flavobacterium sp. KMS]|uniref:hypothetical protein n=1 Tax=Flavobacterium sp. KMS TaxID=1566023 RepID=UPI00057CB0F4|nr:hypothetical protein [Flavobacterium sp. KMS]KIA97325.1 hypothetical protein OA93_15490 [Flavobacterium sp. KMS]